ncbi:MAG: metalloregulator ArsR/SmtB family transcription factor [Patescibacteria group bacterium]
MEDQLVDIFKALGDKTRLEIVVFLAKKGEVACADISERFPLSQPTMSHHYSKLKNAGILHIREEGVKHFYSVDLELLKKHGVEIGKN